MKKMMFKNSVWLGSLMCLSQSAVAATNACELANPFSDVLTDIVLLDGYQKFAGSCAVTEAKNNALMQMAVDDIEFDTKRIDVRKRWSNYDIVDNAPYLKSGPALVNQDGQELKYGEKYEALKKVIAERAAEFKAENICLGGVKIKMNQLIEQQFAIVSGKTKAEVQAVVDDQEKFNAIFDREIVKIEKTLETQRANGLFCETPKRKMGLSQAYAFVKFENDSVSIEASVIVKDNQFKFDGNSKEPAALLNQINQDPVVKKNLACGRVITSIDVQAASNKFENGGEAAKTFGAWDFRGLSEARANEFTEKVLKKVKLGGFDGSNPKDLSGKVNVYLGDHDTGSEGPCPYRLVKVGSKYKVEKDPRVVNAPAELEKVNASKYVRAIIHFSPPKPGCNEEVQKLTNQPIESTVVTHCTSIGFECR